MPNEKPTLTKSWFFWDVRAAAEAIARVLDGPNTPVLPQQQKNALIDALAALEDLNRR
jgi:hypothetical protein